MIQFRKGSPVRYGYTTSRSQSDDFEKGSDGTLETPKLHLGSDRLAALAKIYPPVI